MTRDRPPSDDDRSDASHPRVWGPPGQSPSFFHSWILDDKSYGVWTFRGTFAQHRFVNLRTD